MNRLSMRMVMGGAFLLILSPGAWAAPPHVASTPLPFRNFPSSQELQQQLQPLAPIEIPDPPPHEGAMVGIPYLIEPTDLLLVEVLEALPGRPISGERLVRPDGTISLGFYGDIHVRGLTTEQVKVKILLHLRSYLPDDVLGVYRYLESQEPEPGPAIEEEMPPMPEAPSRSSPLDLPQGQNLPGPQSSRSAPRRRVRRVADGPFPPRLKARALTAPRGEKEQNRLETKLATPGAAEDHGASRPLDPPPPGSARVMAVHPADSDRLFVDVTSYNSKTYFVQGDVAAPGRMPYTGNETILDAINYGGGLLPTADPKNIKLVRPGVGGKAARVYAVDFDAILKQGDPKANYQLFPNDRIVVGRNAVEQATIEIDRVARQVQSVQNGMLMSSLVARSLSQGGTNPFSPSSPISVRIKLGSMTWVFDAGSRPPDLTPEQREKVLKEWVDFYWKAGSRPEGAQLDEKSFREALLRQIALPVIPDKAP